MVVKLSAECRMSHQHVFVFFFLQFSKKFQNDDLIIVEALNSEQVSPTGERECLYKILYQSI